MGLNDTLTRSLVTDGDLTTFTLGGRYGTLETRVMSNCFPIAVLVIQGTRAYENVNDHPDALYYCRFCPRGHCWTSSLSLLEGERPDHRAVFAELETEYTARCHPLGTGRPEPVYS